MPLRYDDRAMPAIARQQREIREQALVPGRDGAVDAIARHHLRDLLRGPLVQVESHLRVAGPEFANHIRQYVACLRMRRADRQAPLALISQLRRQAADGARLLQDPQGPLDDLLSRRGDACEVAPFAHEDLEAELILEQLDL